MVSRDNASNRAKDEPRIRSRGPLGDEVTEPDSDELERAGALVAAISATPHHTVASRRHRLPT